ncbi:MAG: hypothetical protein HKN58_08955, partial [Xanthomonadales bacterium]|nr:hypothetical protein [Xanthomonadales bacterium]
MAILFTFGTNDLGLAEARPDARGQMNIHVDGSSGIISYVDLHNVRAIPYLLYGGNTPQPPLRLPVKPRLVFNQVADPDSHGIALGRCVELCDALGVPVINHPKRIQRTSREQVAQRLDGIPGVRIPRTLRCAPESPEDVFVLAAEAGIAQDFIFRTAGEHNGSNMVRIRGESELRKLHAFPFDGRDFYLIEFVDYSGDESVYRKHRICMIDGKPYPKHSSFHEHWKVHIGAGGGAEFVKEHPEFGTPAELLDELINELLPPARERLQEIDRRLGLDFL